MARLDPTLIAAGRRIRERRLGRSITESRAPLKTARCVDEPCRLSRPMAWRQRSRSSASQSTSRPCTVFVTFCQTDVSDCMETAEQTRAKLQKRARGWPNFVAKLLKTLCLFSFPKVARAC